VREVTDILDPNGAPVAFDQLPNHTYRVVCPWCAQNVDVLSLGPTLTYRKLYDLLFAIQFTHMITCPGRELTSMSVTVKGATQ